MGKTEDYVVGRFLEEEGVEVVVGRWDVDLLVWDSCEIGGRGRSEA